MATYKDLQRLTGLSLSTISKHYNGLPVRPENAAAIEAAAERLGFRVNGFARGLRSRRSRTVGVLLPALDNEFHLSIIAGLERALRGEGIGVLVGVSLPEPGAAVRLLLEKMVDGIVAVPTAGDVAALRDASEQGTPVVTLDWVDDALVTDRVVLDNRAAGASAARLLADHGHRAVAVLGGDPSVSTTRDRTAGFADELAARGLAAPAVEHGPLTVESGVAAMERILARAERPTAVFASNRELTVGALTALGDSGLRIPADLSLVGFDTVELARVVRPRLTIVAQPTEEIAAEAAALIRRRLDGAAEPPETRILPSRLLAGASVHHLHP
ncbi:LacI family DNA-binding transcriptional regulator [Rathayibacter sp. VKM Ac-2760]|uniref:LacI family DNA-binding transcriptional regulator n=1 Tax=Rathayibacter sp. VKM Ac-2760 TaxID=2609253 RepID=UPI0013183195|nr:LacI family DNA-binding transcriptional regulator [Rathayibacter sp. VKM Ac-2760]QHC57468.1 substrate-binding domain-containing protein [Rathayibacter sp. VKM Ac-2760]